MKVALYYPWVYLKSGCERTIDELVAGSRHEWTIFTNRFEPDSTYPRLRERNVVELPRVSVQRSFSHVAAAAWRISWQKLPLDDHQAIVVFCEGLGDFVNIRNNHLPAICVCFTPLRAAFDEHYQSAYLDRHGNKLWRTTALHLFAKAFRGVDRIAWRRYERVFAISQEVRRRIVQGRLYPEEKIEVVHPGVDFSTFTPASQSEKNFLIPGRIMWTKNIELGIAAFRLLLARRPDLSSFRLTISGFVDRKSQPYLAALRRLAADCPQIRLVESPSDSEHMSEYQSAYAIVYPPFNEDWGLVPLEAMALGKPVVALNRGGPRETVLEGETGFLVEPTPEAFADAMERLADDPALAKSMGERGRQYAARFDWKHFCAAVDNSLDELVGQRARA